MSTSLKGGLGEMVWHLDGVCVHDLFAQGIYQHGYGLFTRGGSLGPEGAVFIAGYQVVGICRVAKFPLCRGYPQCR